MISLSLRIASIVMALLTMLLLARLLGAAELGRYAFAQAVVEVLLIPATLGVPILLVREIPAALQQHQGAHVVKLVSHAALLVLGASLLISAFGLVLIGVFEDVVPVGMGTPVLIALSMLPALALCLVWEGALRGAGKLMPAQSLLYLLRPGALLAIVLVFFALSLPLDARATLVINVIATVLAAAAGLLFWRRLRPAAGPGDAAQRRRHHSLPKTAFSFAVIAAASALVAQTDILMLGWLDSAAATGTYRVAHRLAALASLPAIALSAAWTPMISALHARGAIATMRRKGLVVLGLSVASSAAIAIVLASLSGFLLGLFGAEFATATSVLLLLCLAQVFLSSSLPLQALLSMVGAERRLSVILALTLVGNIAANLMLIPTLGDIGAALASVLSLLAGTALLLIAAFRTQNNLSATTSQNL